MALSHTESTLVAIGATIIVLSLVVSIMAIIWQIESRRQRHRELLVQAPPPRPVVYGINLPQPQHQYARVHRSDEGFDAETGFALQGYRGVGSSAIVASKDTAQTKRDSIRQSLVDQHPTGAAENHHSPVAS